MRVSGAVVDLMNSYGASVVTCLEDGWDFSTQVSALYRRRVNVLHVLFVWYDV